MAVTIKELQNQRKSLETSIQALIDKSDAENRDLTAEEETEYRRMMDESKGLKNRIDRHAAAVERAAELAKEKDYGFTNTASGVEGDGENKPTQREVEALAFQGWCFANHQKLRTELTARHKAAMKACGVSRHDESFCVRLGGTDTARKNRMRNAIGTAPGSSGGALIGDLMADRFDVAMLQYGGMLQVAEIIRTATGNPYPWPTFDDTSNKGRQIEEAAPTRTPTDPAFKGLKLGAHKFTSDPLKASYEVLRDSPIDLVGLIGTALGERLGRIVNDKATTGSGGNTMQGVTVGATLGVTAASATAIAYDEVIDLEHSVDPAYRPNGAYMLHDDIVLYLRKLKDGNGQPLWAQSVNAGTPDRLNNRPYIVNQSMATLAAGNRTIVFGDLSMYKVRQVAEVRIIRLVELYRENDQDGFIAFAEFDGGVLDAGTHPIKYLKQA